MTRLKLADISVWNTIKDWAAFSKAVDGVIIKSSQSNWEDKTFRDKYSNAVANHMSVGVFHFYGPKMDWRPQFETFIGIYNSLAVKPKVICLDVEENVYLDRDNTKIVELPDNIDAYSYGIAMFCKSLEEATGIKATIYTRKSWWDKYVRRSGTSVTMGGQKFTMPDWSQYPLWVANYNVAEPVLPVDWKTWTIWQWGTAQVEGAAGLIDQDWFYGSQEEFNSFFGTAPYVPPEYNLKLYWPCDVAYKISQRFGENPAWYAPFGLPGHEGIDFAVPENLPIISCSEGFVEKVETSGPYGTHVVVVNTVGRTTYRIIYAHLNQAFVAVGTKIYAGQHIGKCGSTGNSTGHHLHITLKVDGAKTDKYPAGIIDPEKFLIRQNVAVPVLENLFVVNAGIKNLRLRLSPGLTGKVVGSLNMGQVVPVVDPSLTVDIDGCSWTKISLWVARTQNGDTLGTIQ